MLGGVLARQNTGQERLVRLSRSRCALAQAASRLCGGRSRLGGRRRRLSSTNSRRPAPWAGSAVERRTVRIQNTGEQLIVTIAQGTLFASTSTVRIRWLLQGRTCGRLARTCSKFQHHDLTCLATRRKHSARAAYNPGPVETPRTRPWGVLLQEGGGHPAGVPQHRSRSRGRTIASNLPGWRGAARGVAAVIHASHSRFDRDRNTLINEGGVVSFPAFFPVSAPPPGCRRRRASHLRQSRRGRSYSSHIEERDMPFQIASRREQPVATRCCAR